MLRWYSPFQLPPDVTAALLEFGSETWDPGCASPANSASSRLLIYVPPHLGLENPASLIKRYQDLLTLEKEGLLIHCERVSAFLHQDKQTAEISADVIRKGKDDNHPDGSSREFHRFKATHRQPDPLTALVTLALIREVPAVLDAYLDLELASELVGETPDSHYLETLESITVTEKLLNFITSNPSQDDLKQAQAKINSLEASLENQKYEIQNLNKEIKDQIDNTTGKEEESKERNDLLQSSQAEIKAKAFEISQLNSQIEYLSLSVEEHRQQNTLLLEQLQASCEQLELYYGASNRLKQELENWRNSNQTTQQQHLELTNQFHQLNKHNQEQIEAHQQDMLARDSEIQKKNDEINELKAQVGTLNKTVTKHQDKAHALISQLQHSCERLEHSDSLTQSMKQQIQDLHISREESQQNHQSLLEQFQVTCTLNEQRLLEQSQEIQLLNQQLESLRAVNEVQRDEHLSKIADWQQSCSERDQQLLARDNEIQQIELELKANADEIDTLTTHVSKLQDCRRDDQLQHEVTLAHWSQTYEQQISQLTTQIQDLHISREESKQNHQSLLEQFQVTCTLNEQRLLEQSQEIQLLNQQLESLRAVNEVQRDEHLSKIADWQQSCSERDQQLLARDNEIQQIELELKANADEIDTLTTHVSKLQDCRRDDQLQHEVTLAHWSQTYEQQISQLTTMKQEIQTKEIEFQQKNDEINLLKATIISLRRTIEQRRSQQSALLQQLQSSCETLELYHIDGKNGRRLVEAQARELQRASHLLQRVSLLKGISNKRLPASSKQLLALLEGYRHNLKRAESLLARGGAGNKH